MGSLWTDLNEVKAILEIDPANTDEDAKLTFFIEWVGSWFEELLNRKFLYTQNMVEIYSGTGTGKLPLKLRPVFLTPAPPAVIYDPLAYYGSSPTAFQVNNMSGGTAVQETYGSDYCLQIDEGTTTSRSGILLKINGIWRRPSVRATGYLSPYKGEDTGSYQITYTGGYTSDTMPAHLRMAANYCVAKFRDVFPLGWILPSEGYEDRSISKLQAQSRVWLKDVWPMLNSHRNWKW